MKQALRNMSLWSFYALILLRKIIMAHHLKCQVWWEVGLSVYVLAPSPDPSSPESESEVSGAAFLWNETVTVDVGNVWNGNPIVIASF